MSEDLAQQLLDAAHTAAVDLTNLIKGLQEGHKKGHMETGPAVASAISDSCDVIKNLMQRYSAQVGGDG